MTMRRLLRFKRRHQFTTVFLIALFFRIIAVIFSRGFGFSSEQFIYVGMPNAWIDNIDYRLLDIRNSHATAPEGISLFYFSLNYCWFWFLKFIGITNPSLLAFFSRLLHAMVSLLVVSFGYRITDLISGKKAAWYSALVLAACWFMPYVSVHNIAAFACTPFLLYGTLIIIRQEVLRAAEFDENLHRSSFIVAGFFLGLGFSVWYQSLLFLIGILLSLMILKNFKASIITSIGIILSIGIVQVIPDIIVWGKPFADLRVFIANSADYLFHFTKTPWIYISIVTILLAFIPPVSFMLLFGFFKSAKRNIITFLPVLLYIVYYTIFPNKNEIYILPIIPLFIITGVAGWFSFKENSNFWHKNKLLHKYLWMLTIVVNFILLFFTTTTYSNKAEMKVMSYISNFKDADLIVIEDKCNENYRHPAIFYAKQWPEYMIVNRSNDMDDNIVKMTGKDVDFVIFRGKDNLEERVKIMTEHYPYMQYEATFEPSVLDIFCHKIKGNQQDGSITVYKTVKQ